MRTNIADLTVNESHIPIITYGCSAHILNLLAHDLDIPAVTAHVIRVTKYFRNNHFTKSKFNELKEGRTLVMPQEVRWNKMCKCLE